jgi:mono/diheme cytochrome c family protein
MNSANTTCIAILAFIALACATAVAAEKAPGAAEFHKDVRPLLETYCFDCHADGANKGGVAFDEFKSDQAVLENRELWWKALKNLRAGMMPPAKKSQPSIEEKERIAHWVKSAVFQIDPQNPDPGRVTVRRLNRVEYHNTIRDLLGVDFDTQLEFPPDDTGNGFDNNGDVLTMSPMLLEKYVDAAKTIVAKAVPMVPAVPAEKLIVGRNFLRTDASAVTNTSGSSDSVLSLSYYEPASLATKTDAPHAGHYQLLLDLRASERYVDNQFDYNKCRLVFKADGKVLLSQEFVREGGKMFHFEFNQNWQAGEHALTFELQPLTPDQKQVRTLALRIISVTVRGPLEEKYWVKPANYARTFPRDVPTGVSSRRDYAREILAPFVRRAFRRPVDDQAVNRLVTLAETFYTQPGHTFESGVAQAMVAVLASPRFLFREEAIEPDRTAGTYPNVDEYALASRLSYFLWSSMPDDELLRLASEKKLKANLGTQVKRMLADPRSEALTRNFVGQWLQARDIETVQINARAVLARDDGRPPGARGNGGFFFRPPRADLTPELRKDMRRETEMYFAGIVKENRSVLELLESDYTFLNARLAKHYGLTNLTVNGDELRRVTLPPDCPRGGVLTQGTVLGVTSNPTRTSPVKRGLFILDNILGIPPLPPPPNIPPLEDAVAGITNHTPTLRETLALHRENALCSSCHNRMDPPGLALENFNAMGMWRDKELTQPIESGGKLATGEEFASIQEMKHILATKHQLDFYRTLTGKLLTYALGRGLDYYDVETVDQIVARMEKENGRFSALLMGVVESAPFQKRRDQVVRTAAAEPQIELKPSANEMTALIGESNNTRN